jgi:glutathione synthase
METSSDFIISDAIKQEIIDYCLQNNISVKAKADDEDDEIVHAPLSILPSPFSKQAFEKITECQKIMNTMINNMMQKIPRVRELLHDLGEKDSFVKGLLDISEKVSESERPQKGYLGIIRSDFMFDKETKKPKLIEFNTIAASFGVLSWGINQLHCHLIKKYNMDVDLEKVERKKNPHQLIVDSLKMGYDLYFGDITDTGESRDNNGKAKGIVLNIIGKNERNVNDIGLISSSLYEQHYIPTVYARFDHIQRFWTVSWDNKLFFNTKNFHFHTKNLPEGLPDLVEVAVVYFRHGYDSEQYESEDDWKAREILELSQAIKCPSADLQLLTFKKVQEVLCREEVWREFNENDLDDIQEFFKNMFSLDELNEDTKSIIEKAKKFPRKFIQILH